MTTTSHLQTKPDFYNSKHECDKKKKDIHTTNARYGKKNFKQTHFTAGDEEQFQLYRDNNSNVKSCIREISLKRNMFRQLKRRYWRKNKNITAASVINTFRYVFNKLKKGIFVKIVNNKLKVFLPFSNANFNNEWGDRINAPEKYENIFAFLRYISEKEGHRWNKKYIQNNVNMWYANNCLFRYDISEGDSNVGTIKNMLEQLCSSRDVPDVEFFINRRDFPIIKRDGSEPYDNIWDSINKPLVSHSYTKYSPILSMCKSDNYADVVIPTYEDWARVQSFQDVWFPGSCNSYTADFNIKWKNKKSTAVFRGSSTGCGVTIETNMRLKLAFMSYVGKHDAAGVPYIDAGITKWNLRPRKIMKEKCLQTIDIDYLPFGLVKPLTPLQQSHYKYIINVDGHVSAFRLSMELGMGSVILLVESTWKLWYSDLIEPWTHYVPIKADLSDLFKKIKWCRDNDDKCQKIVSNALAFYHAYLGRDGVLDFMQKTLVDLKKRMGIYLYNVKSPLGIQMENELKGLSYDFPSTTKTIRDISKIPDMNRCYGLLSGIQWVVNMINSQSKFETTARYAGDIFRNKLGVIRKFAIDTMEFAVKTTDNEQKIYEHVHEAYICTKSINKLRKYIPNFTYVFGMYRTGSTYNVITEFIRGETLDTYIQSKRFKFEDFLFILVQVCLSLQIAQNHCGFVHYDLMPWNIMLHDLGHDIEFDYVLSCDQIFRVKTNVIPVIIDCGKSHVIYNQKHYGFINMFSASTAQDIISLLVSTVHQIISDKHLSGFDFHNLLYLANFITGTEYRRQKFGGKKGAARDLKKFTKQARKYASLIFSDKHELELKKPIDLVNYIMNMKGPDRGRRRYESLHTKIYKIDYNHHQYYPPYRLSNGNPRQVFEYILANTVEERAQTYTNVCVQLLRCKLPFSNNLFFNHYIAQQLYDSIILLYNDMMFFFGKKKFNNQMSDKVRVFRETLDYIDGNFSYLLNTADIGANDTVKYKMNTTTTTLVNAPFTVDTFLEPSKIEKLLEKYKKKAVHGDLTHHKLQIEDILLNNGKYKINNKIRNHYLGHFSKLLLSDSFVALNNNANAKTLRYFSNEIFTRNRDFLKKQEKCQEYDKYLQLYNNIIR